MSRPVRVKAVRLRVYDEESVLRTEPPARSPPASTADTTASGSPRSHVIKDLK
ncbi:hypothetical protein OHS70_08500 [Streptomyces sp. NBC_00390]|uniref:hypothetical protein n=1 Tax=Streptomyces sp. NBC_00390 TaxID=2975736 RepID=UPI002E23ECA0